MKIIKEYARHHPDVFDYFSRSRLDAFLDEDVLSVIHGDNWCSVLLAERGNALLHVFAKKPIGETGWYDIEPFIGYAGPVSTTADPSFLAAALESYRDICLGERIVAEVIRFSPILENHSVFADSAIDVVVAKPIIVVACENEESEMMARYSGFCRNRIRRGSKEVTFHEMDRTREMETFAAFLSESLDRVGAESAWRFSPAFFERARDSEKFSLYRVARGDEMLCACMVIFHPRSAYYFLVATSPRRVHGANEILVHGIAREAAARGIPHLILGGGNSDAADDPLLRFKSKFSRAPVPFHIGKLVHEPAVFATLRDAAERASPSIVGSKFFLKYRLELYL